MDIKKCRRIIKEITNWAIDMRVDLMKPVDYDLLLIDVEQIQERLDQIKPWVISEKTKFN